MVDILTPHVVAACDRGIPRSSAATMRWRKSIEYAFIPGVCHMGQGFCPPLYPSGVLSRWRR
jgi:hypothetical protein